MLHHILCIGMRLGTVLLFGVQTGYEYTSYMVPGTWYQVYSYNTNSSGTTGILRFSCTNTLGTNHEKSPCSLLVVIGRGHRCCHLRRMRGLAIPSPIKHHISNTIGPRSVAFNSEHFCWGQVAEGACPVSRRLVRRRATAAYMQHGSREGRCA